MRFQGYSWLGYNSLSLKTVSRGFSSTTIIYVLRSYHHTILDISQCIDILSLKVGTEEPNISCTKCPPGYYSKLGGAFNCTPCSYFEYQSKEGGKKVCCLFICLALSWLQAFRCFSYVKMCYGSMRTILIWSTGSCKRHENAKLAERQACHRL